MRRFYENANMNAVGNVPYVDEPKDEQMGLAILPYYKTFFIV